MNLSPSLPTESSDHPFDQLRRIMQHLRRACPWDRAQTPQSLTRYAIEEAYEVDAAVRSGDVAAVRDELGDLLLQVLFQSCLYEEQGAFGLDEVMAGLQAKLIRRHPHVFGDAEAADAEAVRQHWQQVKAAEKQAAGQPHRLLSGVKPGPALRQAQSLQHLAATVGFDWPDAVGARAKLTEELAELDQAMAVQDMDAIQDELGDVLFSVVNLSRKLGQDSEQALLRTIHKFRQRFDWMEQQLAARQQMVQAAGLDTLEQLWQQAKPHCG